MLSRIADKALQSSLIGDAAAKFGRPISRKGITIDPTLENLPPHVITKVLLGQYEADERSLLKQIISPEDNIIELGGGIGYLSCYINQLLSEPSNHAVVEANPNLIAILKRHKELNNCGFSVHHNAYSTTKQSVSFAIQNDDHLMGSSRHRTTAQQIDVETTDLETFSRQSGFDEYCLVADIEGSEQELIRDEIDELVEHCNKLLLEFHWPLDEIQKSDVDEIKHLLEDNGFSAIHSAMNGRVVAYEKSRI